MADIVPVRSPSLEAVRRGRLFPYQWPWFADGVPTPEDALAAGADLVEVLSRVDELRGSKVLSAEAMLLPDEPDLEWRSAWIKLDDQLLLRVGTQLVTPELSIPRESPETELDYAGGKADYDIRPGSIQVRLVAGNRMAIVRLQATDLGVELSMTQDDLLRVAARIIELQS